MTSSPKQRAVHARIRIVMWSLVLIAIVSIALHYTFGSTQNAAQSGLTAPGSIQGQGELLLRDFKMTTLDGSEISADSLIGRPSIYYFGYTYCPDICPTTLYELSEHYLQLEPDSQNIDVYFVTVDPERDTLDVLSEYMKAFHLRFKALHGTEEETRAIAKAFHVYYKREGEGDRYNVNHTGSLFLIDSNGRLFGTVSPGESQEVTRKKISRLINSNR